MNLRSLMLTAWIGSGLIQISVQSQGQAQGTAPDVGVPLVGTSQMSAQLSQLAKSITVKVFSGETWGSGILIQRQGQVYTVLTNEHVLTPGYGKPYRIQTPDGRVYPADVSRATGFGGNDLGVLQFRSGTEAYAIASLGVSSTVAEGDEAFAAGFPFESKGFAFTTGQISLLLDKALEGGYQIGYTNDIQKGMSGGPLLNRQGQVVGINGRHAYPLWGNPHMFQDGSVPSKPLQEQMIQLSWAVPVQTFARTSLPSAPAPAPRQSPPQESSPIPQPVIVEPKLPNILPPNEWLW